MRDTNIRQPSEFHVALYLLNFVPLILLMIGGILFYAALITSSSALFQVGRVLVPLIALLHLLSILYFVPSASYRIGFWNSHLPLVILVLAYVFLAMCIAYYGVWFLGWGMVKHIPITLVFCSIFIFYSPSIRAYRSAIPVLTFTIVATFLFALISPFRGCNFYIGWIPWTFFWKVIGYGLCL